MIRDERGQKDVKDGTFTLSLPLKDKTLLPIPYQKTSKLVTALYMVTDILDKEEPLRHKLRTLGADIISDIHLIGENQSRDVSSKSACTKISEILSFLDIAGALNLISEMNSNILKKEFSELSQSINLLNSSSALGELSEFLKEEKDTFFQPTRIGVQKGSTLMKALSKVEVSDKIPLMSLRKIVRPTPKGEDSFGDLKRQRREEILKIMKDSSANIDGASEGLTITDIKTVAHDSAEKLQIKALATCGEKTLQRELISMVSDNVLNKTGEKRWSRYAIKN